MTELKTRNTIDPKDVEKAIDAFEAAVEKDADPEELWGRVESFRSEEALRAIEAGGLSERYFASVMGTLRALDMDFGQLFRRRAALYCDRTLLLTFESEEVRQHSWSTLAARFDAVARGLLSLRSDASPVALYTKNCLDGAVADLACLTRGIVDAVIPGTATQDHIEFILAQTRSRVAVAGDAEAYEKLAGAGEAGRALTSIVVIDPAHCPRDPRVLSLEELEKKGREASPEDFPWPKTGLEDLATIMFTSGTSGQPKGICFRHRQIVSKRFARALALPFVQDGNIFVSYLPLFHTFGRWLELTGTIFWGGRYAFASSPSIHSLLENMRRVKATGFISVPLKWLQLRDELAARADLETAPTTEIRRALEKLTGGSLRWGLSAAGYLDPEVFGLMPQLGLELMSGFGMTESTGGITMTPPGGYRAGTVGKALPGIELRQAEDGELHIRGPYVMDDYFGTEKDAGGGDGWFRTGDVFSRDREGYLRILDRKKDIYKNLRGETIAPQRIENLFSELPGIQRTFLVGDRRSYNTLVIIPDLENAEADLGAMSPEELKEFFRADVVAVNRFLSPHERIVDFAVRMRDFSVENGELTAKGTFKRWKVEEACAEIIEPMYKRQFVELSVEGLAVQVPHWFLRAKGMTEASVTAEPDSIVLEDGSRLLIHAGRGGERRLDLGSLEYECRHSVINLDWWLRSAPLWVGNSDLVTFAGPEIATWRALGGTDGVRLCSNPRRRPLSWQHGLPELPKEGGEDALLNLHKAACLLADPNTQVAEALIAVRHLGDVLLHGTYEYAALARKRLAWAAYYDEIEVRTLAYTTLLRGEEDTGTKDYFLAFLDSGRPFLNETAIERICGERLDDEQLTALRSRMEYYRSALKWPVERTAVEQFSHLIDLMANHGIKHPDSYAAVRNELAAWQQFPGSAALKRQADDCLATLTQQFRRGAAASNRERWETRPSKWAKIVDFELGVDLEDQRRIQDALTSAHPLWESIFVLFEGKQISERELSAGSVWVSMIGGRFGTALYHVVVETHDNERFEFRLALNKSRSPEEFCTDEYLRMAFGGLPKRTPKVSRSGGIWPELGMASREYIRGETLLGMWLRINAMSPGEIDTQDRWVCRHYLRLAMAAYVDFWNASRQTWMLRAPTPREVIIVRQEATRSVRLANITGRAPYTNPLDLILALHQGFYRSLSHNCPALRECLQPELVFEAILQVLGEKPGLDFLAEARRLLEGREDTTPQVRRLLERTKRFADAIAAEGFRPLQMRAAVQRYKRWKKLNPDATQEAKLRTLLGVYRWHNIADIEERHPEVRFLLFRETFWAKAPEPLGPALDQAIQQMRTAKEPQQQTIRRVSELRMDLRLSEEDERFLTYLTYPDLQPDQKPRLEPSEDSEREGVALTTTISDKLGGHYDIRPAASPREMARLARLFRSSNIKVKMESKHESLVAVDERRNIVAGWFYWMLDEEHVFVHGLVIAGAFRNRGLGRELVEDFLNRLRSDGVRRVTVDYIVPDFWMRMGFKANPKYGGLTKVLDPA